jgi:hypothetical protein
LFYACAARHTLPHLIPRAINDIVLTIVQPRARGGDPVTQVTVNHSDLDAFEQALIAAIELSAKPNAPIKLGDHCRFAVCRTVCPLHLAPLLDFSEMYPSEIKTSPITGNVLADILDLADLIEPVLIEARRQAHDLLEAGGDVPGYKLVPKRAQRKWALDESSIIKALRKLKVKKPQAMVTSLKTPAQIEKLLPKGTELPDVLISKVSSGTTLAKADDKRLSVQSIGAVITEIMATLEEN